ncbi:hypothetical protein B1992_04595 [Pseudoxanthomonas broegbernensis]|uniref:Uncharacterized protein n=1 Tax=Pseudoxanthomonas broegbernensis TaxID=83619 RepID=A0A7V8K817_9GAMM|nr:hypothetical protein [Pseudoxanthomonas broegbernensis]KAF1687265.1 hypothetical protein B1992_04595 [Pseudoxanthomonas broegbernensis]MBB6065743.1 hypothetical protein [Pseudoxanthomonas broegbernensis]
MPAESTQAAALTFDAAVYRALSRRRSDTPHPHNGAPAPDDAPQDAPGKRRPPDIPAAAGHGSRKSSG